MIMFKLKPFDVLYFGSGKTLSVATSVKSIFPPYPHTIAGAICSKIHKKTGIDVSQILKYIYGPFLFNEAENQIYFSIPADIYKVRKSEKLEKIFFIEPLWNFLKLFNPENTNKPIYVNTLAVYKGSNEIEPIDNGLISKNGLKYWLEGKKTEIENKDIKTFENVFEYENRIGIKQKIETHTVAGEDSVFRISFLRLKDNWAFIVLVKFNYENEELQKANLDNDEKMLDFFNDEINILKLGGEMKNVYYKVEKVGDIKDIFHFEKPNLSQGDKIKLLFLTPGVFEGDILKIKGLKVLTIILHNYVNLGLSSPCFLRKYNFIKRAYPPGSVIYAEVEDKDEVKKLWLNPSDGSNNFIGSNLIIYTKTE